MLHPSVSLSVLSLGAAPAHGAAARSHHAEVRRGAAGVREAAASTPDTVV